MEKVLSVEALLEAALEDVRQGHTRMAEAHLSHAMELLEGETMERTAKGYLKSAYGWIAEGRRMLELAEQTCSTEGVRECQREAADLEAKVFGEFVQAERNGGLIPVTIWHGQGRTRFFEGWSPGKPISEAFTYLAVDDRKETAFADTQSVEGMAARNEEFKKRSTSVGDVVVIAGHAWAVEMVGWTEVEHEDVIAADVGEPVWCGNCHRVLRWEKRPIDDDDPLACNCGAPTEEG